MHSFMSSIGFSDLKGKKELDKIIEEVIQNYDEKTVVESHPDCLYAEISKDYGCDFGITVCGEYNENNEFQMEYYYPYFRGTGITTQDRVLIERHAGTESYAGACDDVRIGVTIIFYLQNGGEYLNEQYKGMFIEDSRPITLSGLSRSGNILLPVQKNKKEVQIEQEAARNRNQLILEARKGDEDAIENLTMDDIDLYTTISQRIQHEDLFSIVDSYFMPYGIECDQYSVMGEILEYHSFHNICTNEEIYQLTLNCNDMQFDICINKKDLLGEPEVGRRFKGSIWLQGQLHF